MEINYSRNFLDIDKVPIKKIDIFTRDNNNEIHVLHPTDGYYILENVEPGPYKFLRVQLKIQETDITSYLFININMNFQVQERCVKYLGHIKFTLFRIGKEFKKSCARSIDMEDAKEYIIKRAGTESIWLQYPIHVMEDICAPFNSE